MMVLHKLPPSRTQARLPAITIGVRLQAEIQRRVRELENRCPRAMTGHERRELAALRDLLANQRKEIWHDQEI